MPPKTLAVTLPQMGESVTEGVVGSWRKQVGDQVAAGETLVEIQTDKIDAEVPAPESGQLVRILAAEGDVVAVGGPLAEIEVGAGVNGSPSAPAREVAAPPAGPASPAAEPVPVPLPALGESVTEGVVGTWRKQVGDQISAGETLVEIQTDKVTAELPSPCRWTGAGGDGARGGDGCGGRSAGPDRAGSNRYLAGPPSGRTAARSHATSPDGARPLRRGRHAPGAPGSGPPRRGSGPGSGQRARRGGQAR